MLLFKTEFWAGLVSGAITLTFRRWQQPHVRVGGRYRCHPIGVLEVDDVRLVGATDITDEDAVRSGFPSRDALLAYLGELDVDDKIYRVQLHFGGDGDRVEVALSDALTAEDVEAIRARLAKMDQGAPWTQGTLAIIEARPRVAASKLASSLGRETQHFKRDVRRLKKLGLTQSFEEGYEISPRGRAWLAAVRGG
jgi:hypothetical protein